MEKRLAWCLVECVCATGALTKGLAAAAAGLYYLAELLEEHTQLAKRVIAYISEVSVSH